MYYVYNYQMAGRNVTTPPSSCPQICLGFWLRRREFVGLHHALKVRFLVGSIAERLALGSATPAKSDLGSPSQAVGLAVLIHYLHFTIDKQRSIINHGHLDVWHSILRSKLVKF